MVRARRILMSTVAMGAILALVACGGAGTSGSDGPVGDPQPGGTATILSINEPRSLDPALMLNSWANNAVYGNALYGTLMTNDPETGEINYRMAESFTTEDGGKTFELKLREGLTFSDGSPLDAEAVKFNWDRIADPATGASSIRDAALIESSEVVDARTLQVTMTEAVPAYGQAVLASSMNWIASPDALRQGQQAFDQDPVGAGPFTVDTWRRQGALELDKNSKYWDQPKPYLDSVTIRATPDSQQRHNTLVSGGAEIAVDTNWETIDQAREQGLGVDVVPLGGGQAFTLNTREAPFDDVRARRAVSSALDLEAIDLAVYEGKGKVPHTLFAESSPFFADVPLRSQDEQRAQRLFDELAAEGKPVSFTFTSYPTPEAQRAAESVQAQLSTFRNVNVEVRTVDLSEISSLYASHDFDLIISSTLLADPEPQLWSVLHGESPANNSGIDDPQLNAALDEGRRATDEQVRKSAYETVQQRLVETVPVIYYTRASPAVVTNESTHGARQYAFGSLLPGQLWVEQ